jgi:hypothetical protein
MASGMRKANEQQFGFTYGYRVLAYTGLSALAFLDLAHSQGHALLTTLALLVSALGLLMETLTVQPTDSSQG